MSINIVTPNSPSPAPLNAGQRVSSPLAPQTPELPLVADPVIDLLKKLLPVDRPVGAALEEFRQASALIMMDSNIPKDQAFVKLVVLLRTLPVELKNLTGQQLYSILERLGLRYEPMIQSSLADGLPLSEESLTASNLKAALLKLVKDQPVGGIEDAQDPLTLPSTAPASTAELRQQAEQLLTSIERTQVLNSLNYEKGQPLTFQIPFALDGRTGTAEFYVEQREGDDPKEGARDRHFTVVAFLELATIGPLRIDLALHQNHLSVKVTVEREETLRFTRALMDELKQALDRQGFMVDFLSCERQPDVRVHHEDVKDRALPSESHLISLRI